MPHLSTIPTEYVNSNAVFKSFEMYVRFYVFANRYGSFRYIENPAFYGHGLIAVGHITYRVHVLRQTRDKYHNIDPSLNRKLKASLKLLILDISL